MRNGDPAGRIRGRPDDNATAGALGHLPRGDCLVLVREPVHHVVDERLEGPHHLVAVLDLEV